MNTLLFTSRKREKLAVLRAGYALFKRSLALFSAALLLIFAGNAFAIDVSIGLAILNDMDDNGNITVVNGSKVMVEYEVTGPDAKMLNKGDKIQLARVSNDSVVSSVARGKKKSGTASLLVKKSEDEALYVRYVRKGEADPSATASHPDDIDYIPLMSIPKSNLGDLAIRMNAVETGPTVTGAGDLTMIQGTFNTAGDVLGGSGFTVEKIGTGDYTITFDNSFGGFPAVTYSTNALPLFVVSGVLGFGFVTVKVRDTAGTLVDPNAWVSFIAVGPR